VSEDKKDAPKPAAQIEKFSEEEQKQLIEKFKTELTEEDEESMMLYASLVFQSKT
jgi:hypothetical protein